MTWTFDLNYFVLGVIFFTLAFLLALRGFWCWYFKISGIQQALADIKKLLEQKD